MSGPGSKVARRQRQRTAESERMMVPGFPEIVRRESQCRLCGLVDDDPDLLRWIHELKVQGAGVRHLETATREKWAERNEVALDHQCFARHFKTHVDLNDLLTSVADGILKAPTMAVFSREAKAVANDIDREVFGDNSDFFDMKDIIGKLKNWVDSLDEDNGESLRNEEGRLDTYRLVAAMRLVAELRQSIEAYNRMKNTERVAKLMLEGQTKRYAQHMSEPIVDELRALQAAIEDGEDERALSIVHMLLAERVGEIMQRAAESSLKESFESYRMH